MKTNIILVGFDLPFINKLGQKLANALDYKYINSGDLLDERLLKDIDLPLNIATLSAELGERQLFNKIADKENIIATISINDFIANDNYEIFDNSYIILVIKTNNIANNSKNNFNLTENLINFAKKHSDLVLKQENLEINNILNKIKG